jgi:hypothetical protein
MKFQKLFVIAAIVCLLVGASGPAQAGPRQDAREIIADFCETVSSEAADAAEKLGNAAEDLAECVDDFGECRDGGLFGNDPLVECLDKGINCASRSAEDKAQACGEFVTDFGDAYERALRQARRQGQRVEDLVQDFFNDQSPKRRICLAPAIQVSRACADNPE